MNPASSNASTPGGKSVNVSSSHSPLQQQNNQVTSPSFESRRSASSSAQSHSSPRNNQGNRKQHKNSRKPRLADEDAMAESVSQPQAILMFHEDLRSPYHTHGIHVLSPD
jgi:hypothetical protein